MRQWLKRSRDRLNNERRFQRGPSSVISKSLGDLPMNGSGVGMFFSRLMNSATTAILVTL